MLTLTVKCEITGDPVHNRRGPTVVGKCFLKTTPPRNQRRQLRFSSSSPCFFQSLQQLPLLVIHFPPQEVLMGSNQIEIFVRKLSETFSIHFPLTFEGKKGQFQSDRWSMWGFSLHPASQWAKQSISNLFLTKEELIHFSCESTNLRASQLQEVSAQAFPRSAPSPWLT